MQIKGPYVFRLGNQLLSGCAASSKPDRCIFVSGFRQDFRLVAAFHPEGK